MSSQAYTMDLNEERSFHPDGSMICRYSLLILILRKRRMTTIIYFYPIRNRLTIILSVTAVAIRIFASFPDAVEKYYSTGAYPYISAFQRVLLGWIPFSVGDLFYGAAGAYLLYSFIKFVRRIVKKKADRQYYKNVTLNFITAALAVYVVFNLFWGLNYNRRGIDYQLKLDKLDYNNDDRKE
jgi:hypothetical protein